MFNLPVDAATCKGVFPSLFVIHRQDSNDNSIIICTSCLTTSSSAMKTAACYTVSPDVLILVVMAESVCSLYISTISFHPPVMVYLYKFRASSFSCFRRLSLSSSIFIFFDSSNFMLTILGTMTKINAIRYKNRGLSTSQCWKCVSVFMLYI